MLDNARTGTQDGKKLNRLLTEIYRKLFARYGCQHWWPGETPFEVMVGAILTQSCSWINVEKAIASLKEAGLMSPEALRNATPEKLAALIHPSGYYNVKAKKIKALVEWLGADCRDDISSLSKVGTGELRRELLAVYGIGEETVDSILLYACGRPVFVVDAYTRRILTRLGFANGLKSYGEFQAFFMDNLPHDAALFNEYHALFVRLGKEVCKKTASCGGCCLGDICPEAKKQSERLSCRRP